MGGYRVFTQTWGASPPSTLAESGLTALSRLSHPAPAFHHPARWRDLSPARSYTNHQ